MAYGDLTEEDGTALDDACGRLDVSDSMLLIVESSLLNGSITHVTDNLLSRDRYGIYITLNRPHEAVKRMLRKASIDLERLYLIDCVTSLAHETRSLPQERVIFANSPDDLGIDGSIPFAVARFVHSVPGEKFIIIDALRTLFLYSEPSKVNSFIHSLLKLTKDHEIKVVVLARKDDIKLVELVSHSFDEIFQA
jgi:hypothetical protein